jgi:hypothetical protein
MESRKYLMGHALPDVAAEYGDFELDTMSDLLGRIPVLG